MNPVPLEISILFHTLLVLLSLLIIRETYQFWIHPIEYLRSAENLVEAVMVILVSFLLLWGDYCEYLDDKRFMSSVVIVLAWALFITMLSRHPKAGEYTLFFTMFYKVKYIKPFL